MREAPVNSPVVAELLPGSGGDSSRCANEARLNAIRQTGLLDSRPDGTFDRYTRIATRLLAAPISLVTLVDDQRQYFLGANGPSYPWQAGCSTALTHSLCKFVVSARAILALPDARADSRFSTCGAVQELRVVAYLGIPIITPNSEAVGAFCVIDNVPRSWSPEEVQLLEDLGALVNKEVALHWHASERKRLAEVLQTDETLAEKITEISPANLYVCDAQDGHCIYTNREFWPALGYTAEQVKAMGREILQQLMHPDDFPDFVQHMAELRALPDGEPLSFEYRLRHANGGWRHFYSRNTILSRDAGGKVQRIVGGALDITALKEAEQLLRNADQRKDEFLAMLAHELRNPLAAIRHAVDVLGEPVEDHEAIAWARVVLDRQSRQLAAIVDDLLDIARIARGKLTLRRVPVDFAAVVQRAIQMLTPPAQARNQILTLSIAGEHLWVEGDPARLEQIVVNLVNNAIKHCDDGIHITASLQREGSNVFLRVCDDGVGIDPDRLEQIFELFSQVPANSERAADGLGIGLTLIKSLTEMHGGSVRALSEGRDRGSEFQVRLPAWEPPKAAPETTLRVPRAAKTEADAGKRERVLIVDDNEDSVHGLTRILERRGYKVASVHTGAMTLSAAQEFHPDAVLLDIGLPGMNGHQVAEQLRANGFDETLLLAITGYGQERDIARSREAGCDFHFVKPVDTDALLAVLEGKETADQRRLR